MKKFLLTITILFLIPFSLKSQIINNYGLKIGFAQTTQNSDNKVYNQTINFTDGFSISAFVDLFNFNGFSISPEIKYIQKGAQFNVLPQLEYGPAVVIYQKYKLHQSYLSIPIFLIYKKELAVGEPYIKIAPRYDILLRTTDNINSSNSYYNNVDFKNVFGGSLSIGIIPKINFIFKPILELSYQTDFTESYMINGNSMKNEVFEFSLGFIL